MNDSFLVRVLDSLADLNEQLEPLDRGKIILLAEVSDFDAADQFHDKVRATAFYRSVGVP